MMLRPFQVAECAPAGATRVYVSPELGSVMAMGVGALFQRLFPNDPLTPGAVATCLGLDWFIDERLAIDEAWYE